MHPYFVKNVLYPIHERLKGNSTIKVLQDLDKSQWFGRARLEAIKLNKVKALLTHAYITIPYNRMLFDNLDIHPNDVITLTDYCKIPFIDKDIIRSNQKMLMSDNYMGKRIPYTTGGSTGEPMRFFVDSPRVSNEWAANWRARNWWGVNIGDPQVSIWASPIEASSQGRIKNVRDWLLNQKIISALDLQPPDGSRVS